MNAKIVSTVGTSYPTANGGTISPAPNTSQLSVSATCEHYRDNDLHLLERQGAPYEKVTITSSCRVERLACPVTAETQNIVACSQVRQTIVFQQLL